MGYFFTIGILVFLINLCLSIHEIYASANSTLGEPINGTSGGINKQVTNITATNVTDDNITQKMEFLNRVLR